MLTSAGRVVAAAPVAFQAPDTAVAAAAAKGSLDDTPGACVTVGHKWINGSDAFVARPAVQGALPSSSSICSSSTHSMTASFGPFKACGTLQAVLVSSIRDSSGKLTHSIHTTRINVVGCNAARLAAATAQISSFLPPGTALYTAYPENNNKNNSVAAGAAAAKPAAVAIRAAAQAEPGQPCVRGPSFWRACVAAATGSSSSSSSSSKPLVVADEACLVIDQRLPGGRGPGTPFFQLKSSQTKHTYGSILVSDSSSSKASSVFFKIAQSYVAAQLNQLSGVSLPPDVRQAQVTLAVKFFSVVTENSTVKKELARKAAAAEAVLSRFNRGEMPGAPACRLHA
ncbi:hypothetical protein OEZ85_009250 [Tetradesmus obliquus]|uniref:Uncharacterized protein n=1 Tax=Tetradesmus obliquus TaxID=3088 RepID=A0ABY8U967_TETOB|nr:hypothetical protein OEZ85_009250 [Tetradesmus obliquus]